MTRSEHALNSVTECQGTPSSPIAQPDELEPFRITRADFLYKTVKNAKWTRLPSPIDDWKHNIYGIYIDGRMSLSQKHPDLGSRCHVKFILKAPVMKTEGPQTTLTAECVEIQYPSFDTHPYCKDKARAAEYAKTMPLATLGTKIFAVKLRNLSKMDTIGNHITYDHVVREQILNLLDRGYRTYMKDRQTIRELRIRTTHPPQPCSSSSNMSNSGEQLSTPHTTPITTPRTTPQSSSLNIPPSTPRPEEQLSTPPETTTTMTTPPTTPRPCNSPLNVSHYESRWDAQSSPQATLASITTPPQPSSGPPSVVYLDKELGERMQVHEVTAAEGEHRLRWGLEDERRAMVEAVTAAINREWEKTVADGVADYRARAAYAMRQIIAEGKHYVGYMVREP